MAKAAGNAIGSIGDGSFSVGQNGVVAGTILDVPEAGGAKTYSVVDERTKLTNLGYNANTWGKFIPITQGMTALAGDCVWAGGFRERYQALYWQRAKSAGKRNKWRWTLGYYYTSNMIYGFGYNTDPTRKRYLNKITLNGTIVYDRATGYRYPGLNFNFEQGTLEQQRDPAYFKDKGDAAVAFRGMMTLALYELPIEDFGTAIPDCVIEVYTDPATPLVTEEFTTPISADNDFYKIGFFDWLARTVAVTSADRKSISMFDIDTRNELWRIDINSDGIEERSWAYAPWANAIIAGIGGGNAYPLVVFDITTGREIGRFGVYNSFLTDLFGNPPRIWFRYSTAVAPGNGILAYIATSSALYGEINILAWTNQQADGIDNNAGYNGTIKAVAQHPLPGNARRLVGHPNDSMFFYAWNDKIGIVTLGEYTTAPVWEDEAWTIPAADAGFVPESIFVWNGLLILACRHGNTDLGTIWYGIDIETRETYWRTQTNFVMWSDTGNHQQSNLTDGTFAWSGQGGFYILNLASGSVEFLPGVGIGEGAWDSETYSMIIPRINAPPIRQYARSPGQGMTRLDEIIENLMTYNGEIDPTDVTVIDIDDEVLGVFINREISVDATLTSILALFRINKVERDGKFVFYRNQDEDGVITADIVIPHAELAVKGDDDDERVSLSYRRVDELDLPSTITVQFINPDMMYTEDSYTWARPRVASASRTSATYAVPIVMSKTMAANLVHNMLYDVWTGRTVVDGLFPQKYGRCDPGSIVGIDRGKWIDLVKVVETTENADFSISFTGELVRAQTKSALVADPYVPRPPILQGRPDSTLLFFDTPTLGPSDDPPEGLLQVYYTASSKGQKNWPGAMIIRGSANGVMTNVALVSGTSDPGKCLNVLPNDPICDGLVVLFGGGTVFGVDRTLEEVLGDTTMNLAFYGDNGRWEIVQFTTTYIEQGKVVIGGIVRGRRGTEMMIDTHQVGDRFVPITSSVMYERVSDVMLGEDVSLAAVGNGSSVGDADWIFETVDGNSNKPWAPAIDTQATVAGGDIGLSWHRRDRKGFTELGTATPQPMSEATEEYELELRDDAGEVFKTVQGLTAPAWTYTEASRLADGLSALPDTLDVTVYQMSALVGRGFAGRATVYVQ